MRALGARVTLCENLRDPDPNPCALARDGAILLSLGSPFLIPSDLVSVYRGLAFNCHNAPLPEWRGGGGFSWRIMAGDRRGRTCVHVVAPGVDGGGLVLSVDYVFPASARLPRDYQEYSVLQAKPALGGFIAQLANGIRPEPAPQDHSIATYFPRLNTEAQGWIDWSWPGAQIERFILAFSHPYSGAKTLLGTEAVKIFDARFSQSESHSFFSGLIVRDAPLTIACQDGVLVCSETETTARVRVGDRLITPADVLNRAMEMRPIYTPTGLKP